MDVAFAIDDADLACADAEAYVVAAFAKVEAKKVGGAKCLAVRGEDALDFVADGRVEGFDSVLGERGEGSFEGAVECGAVVLARVDDVADDRDGVSARLQSCHV